ncbi:MAG: protein-disulfide reductase DsbD domain-containing protein [Pyrinomonadaceae bacterium]
MNNKIFGKLFFCLALIFGAFVFEAHAQGSVDLSGSIGNGKLQKGKTATATIVMDIPGGLHVNTNRPGNQYSIPLKIRVTGAGLKLGAVSYPRGTTKKFSFSEDTLNVYEGRTTFRFPVTIPANFKGNAAKISVVASYQSCTDEVCYRPRSGEVTLSAAVK